MRTFHLACALFLRAPEELHRFSIGASFPLNMGKGGGKGKWWNFRPPPRPPQPPQGEPPAMAATPAVAVKPASAPSTSKAEPKPASMTPAKAASAAEADAAPPSNPSGQQAQGQKRKATSQPVENSKILGLAASTVDSFGITLHIQPGKQMILLSSAAIAAAIAETSSEACRGTKAERLWVLPTFGTLMDLSAYTVFQAMFMEEQGLVKQSNVPGIHIEYPDVATTLKSMREAFASTMEWIMQDVITKYGWSYGSDAFEGLEFAESAFVDDCILWNGSKPVLARRKRELVQELGLWGLHVNAKKCQAYASPYAKERGALKVGDLNLELDEKLDVMGIPFRVGISPKEALQGIFAKVKSKYWACKHLYRAKTGLKCRVELIQKVLGGTSLWCVGAFLPDRQSLHAINVLQAQLVMWSMRLMNHGQSTVLGV